MYTDVRIILKTVEKDQFTGHLKIGIEAGKVVSLQRNFNDTVKSVKHKIHDYDNELKSMDSWLKYGSVEFDVESGILVGMNASDYLNGGDLRTWLDGNKCRFVKIVEKKSNS